MARHEHDREDLLRDAVAMVERIAWHDSNGAELFVGFRKSGAASVYLDQDPAYHFNSSGELRRGYVDGELLKAEAGKLRAMHRERPGGEVQLVSRQLDHTETEQLLTRIQRELTKLVAEIDQHRLQLVGCVPTESPVAQRASQWITDLLSKPVSIANSPHAK